MNQYAKPIAAVLIIAMGMVGLYFKVEYSGWVLTAGLLVLIN
jgi:hypothetical protein